MAQIEVGQRASERLAVAIDTLKELIKTRPELKAGNEKAIRAWITKYQEQEFLGKDKSGNQYYRDVKKSFNEAIKPIKEAFKIVEAFYTEAQFGRPKELQFSIEANTKY